MMTDHISQDDLYLFALQLLPEVEMRAAALHLKDCAACRTQVGEIQGDLVLYAMTAEMQAPPGQARERLLKQVASEKKIVPLNGTEADRTAKATERTEKPVDHPDKAVEPVLYPRSSRVFQMESPEEREKNRVAPILAWTGWAVAAAAVVVAGMQFNDRKQDENNLAAVSAQMDATSAQAEQAKALMQTLNDTTAMQVALHVPLTAGAQPKLDPEAHATYVPATGSLVFVASHLDPLETAKTYELWLLPSQAGQSPVPAGLFKPDANGDATVVMPELPKGVTAKGFGVTVENDGGSKSPTAPIVLAGM